MKLHLVQILVVVANIQVKFLKTDEEIGFMRTAIDHELVDPKTKINLENRIFCIKNTVKRISFMLKGNKFNIT